jgi:ADP-heptose:LPS heptosyltransferase
MRIIIAPYPKPLRNGKKSAKCYPYWKELLDLLKENEIIQIGVSGEEPLVPDFRKNMSLFEIEDLIKSSDFWISVDSFLQHVAQTIDKRGVVLWGTSHPEIFGYSTNCNILKDEKYLRKDPFYWWEDEEHNPDAFVKADEVYSIIQKEFME